MRAAGDGLRVFDRDCLPLRGMVGVSAGKGSSRGVLVGEDGNLWGAQRCGADRATPPGGVAIVELDTWCPGCRAPLHMRGRGEDCSPAGEDGTVFGAFETELVYVMTTLLPLAYGYLRDDLVDDRDRVGGEDALRAAALSLGCELASVFHEQSPEAGLLPPAFADLIHECRRAAAHTVITLQGHLSNMSMSRMVLREVLHVRAEAVVHEVGR